MKMFPSSSPSIQKKAKSACAAALLTSLAVTPFDVVKTRIQIQSAGSSHHVARLIFQKEGILAFWRGLSPTLLMAVPATVIYYVGYEQLRDILNPITQTYSPFLAGSLARVVAASTISPIELVRTRMQSGIPNPVASTMDLIKTQGISTLWRGLVPTLWRDVPFSGLYWMTYEILRRRLDESTQTAHWSPFRIAFVSGALSGVLAATLTTPFDVVKTLRQVYLDPSTSITASPSASLSRSIAPAFASSFSNNSALSHKTHHLLYALYKSEGTRGLFRGLSARILKVAPACAIMISTYEAGKNVFGE